MSTLLVLLAVLAVAYTVYRFRVPILAKVLGQPQSRVQRHLERRRD